MTRDTRTEPRRGPTLSPRLAAIVDLVPRAGSVADVGCDHAHVSIALATGDQRVIACDRAEGALAMGRDQARRFGVTGIDFRLGDGLDPLEPGEVDTVVLAGMGHLTIVDVLDRARDDVLGARRLVVQPTTAIPLVRRDLARRGWRCAAETVVRDRGRFHWTLGLDRDPSAATAARPWHADPYTIREWAVGEIVGRSAHEVYAAWLGAERTRVSTCLLRIANGRSPETNRNRFLAYRRILDAEVSRQQAEART